MNAVAGSTGLGVSPNPSRYLSRDRLYDGSY